MLRMRMPTSQYMAQQGQPGPPQQAQAFHTGNMAPRQQFIRYIILVFFINKNLFIFISNSCCCKSVVIIGFSGIPNYKKAIKAVSRSH